MNIKQKTIQIHPKPRGFHLITNEIISQLPEMRPFKVGLLHLFLQHTSASLSINENADSDVRQDLEAYFNQAVPENAPYYQHILEGPDDMPAHIKCSLLGNHLCVPITNGQLNLGTWQGLYLCEHRNHGGHRSIVATLTGDTP